MSPTRADLGATINRAHNHREAIRLSSATIGSGWAAETDGTLLLCAGSGGGRLE